MTYIEMVFCICVSIFAAYLFIKEILLFKWCTEEVDAVIVDMDVYVQVKRRYVTPTYRYKYRHRWYTSKPEEGVPFDDKGKKIGMHTKIYVSKKNPSLCISSRNVLERVLFLCFSLFGVFAGLAMAMSIGGF